MSSEHLLLRGEHPKFFPKIVGPSLIKELRGVNTVELQIDRRTRFGLIDPVVNVDRLRPHKRRPSRLGPSEENVQPEALVVDPGRMQYTYYYKLYIYIYLFVIPKFLCVCVCV